MPRQPFVITRFSDDVHIAIGPDSLGKRPEHTAVIGECLALWPEIESQQAILLAALLKAESTAAIAVYHTLRRSTQKLAALEAATKDRLDQKDRELFNAVMSIVRSVESERNFYAHALYGHCDALPDSILCLDQNSFSKFALRHIPYWRSSSNFSQSESEEVTKNLFHATLKDLRQLRSQIKDCFEICFQFNGIILASNHGNASDHLYETLTQISTVADALLRLRQAAAQKSE